MQVNQTPEFVGGILPEKDKICEDRCEDDSRFMCSTVIGMKLNLNLVGEEVIWD